MEQDSFVGKDMNSVYGDHRRQQRIRNVERLKGSDPEVIIDVLDTNSEHDLSLTWTGEAWMLKDGAGCIGSGSLSDCAIAYMNFYIKNP